MSEQRLPIAIFTLAINIKSWGLGVFYNREKIPTDLGNGGDEIGYFTVMFLFIHFHIRFMKRQKQDWLFYFDISSKAKFNIGY